VGKLLGLRLDVGKLWIPHHFSFPLVVEPGIDKLAEEYRDIGGILGIWEVIGDWRFKGWPQ
jgi:hypothetical protein